MLGDAIASKKSKKTVLFHDHYHHDDHHHLVHVDIEEVDHPRDPVVLSHNLSSLCWSKAFKGVLLDYCLAEMTLFGHQLKTR